MTHFISRRHICLRQIRAMHGLLHTEEERRAKEAAFNYKQQQQQQQRAVMTIHPQLKLMAVKNTHDVLSCAAGLLLCFLMMVLPATEKYK